MSTQSNKGIYKIIIGVLLMVLIVIFALQNNQDTEVKLWFTSFKSPLIILFLICFIFGLFFAVLAVFPLYSNSKRKSKLIDELKKRVDTLEKELKEKL